MDIRGQERADLSAANCHQAAEERIAHSIAHPAASSALVARINVEHKLAQAHAESSIEHAIRVGRLLMEAREGMRHGSWLPWIRKHCAFGPRMAQNYIRLARSESVLGLSDAKRVSHSSLRSALRAANATDHPQQVHYSSNSSEWYTPSSVIDLVIKVMGGIDLDPCSNSVEHPNVPAAKHYSIAEDGLSQEWSGRVFLNPPYGRTIHRWTQKLRGSFEGDEVCQAIALLPARTDTGWMFGLRQFPRCFLRGRLRFSNAETSAPFPSVVVYLGAAQSVFSEVFGALGDTYALIGAEKLNS